MVYRIFLAGEDDPDNVRSMRLDIISAISRGKTVTWTVQNSSVTKAGNMDLLQLLRECNFFLRINDPIVATNNPVFTETRPNLLFP